MKQMKNVILSVTDECNLSCEYCFASCNKRAVDVKVVNEQFEKEIPAYVKVIKEVCVENEYNKTQVIFHGGEPLLISIQNYEKLISQLVEYDIDYVMQSNGTIMNDDIYNFLIKYGIRIGISLDGPQNIHDALRLTKTGNGSFESIMKTIDFLQNKNYKFSCLATITKHSIGKEKAIYDFFNEKRISFDFNPVFSVMEGGEQDYLIDQNAYASFVIKMFDIWFNSEDNLMIVKFYNIINALVKNGKMLKKCDCTDNCSVFFVAVDNKGDLYNCSRFVGYEDYKLSNINDTDFSVSFGLPGISQRSINLKKGLCKKCEIWDLCHGGCPYNALEHNGDINSKDYFCEGRRRIYLHILNELKKYKRS